MIRLQFNYSKIDIKDLSPVNFGDIIEYNMNIKNKARPVFFKQ